MNYAIEVLERELDKLRKTEAHWRTMPLITEAKIYYQANIAKQEQVKKAIHSLYTKA
jgi:hypothetical protein